ncbi:MAG: AMP-binding protein, partial [Acidimicrobiia bacterium]|nr:AMP-binding protein [Acidimicrobiia bacterium]
MALKATLRPTWAAHYLEPGGAWDVPSLDAVLAEKTPGPVAERIASVAGGLRARGVRRGDPVAWQLRNVDEAVMLYRACWRLGAVAVPVHHSMGTADVAAALAQVEPRVTLTAPADVDGLVRLAPPVTAAQSAARPADLAVALFTSGSTGTPKAVLHTQRGLAYKA